MTVAQTGGSAVFLCLPNVSNLPRFPACFCSARGYAGGGEGWRYAVSGKKDLLLLFSHDTGFFTQLRRDRADTLTQK